MPPRQGDSYVHRFWGWDVGPFREGLYSVYPTGTIPAADRTGQHDIPKSATAAVLGPKGSSCALPPLPTPAPLPSPSSPPCSPLPFLLPLLPSPSLLPSPFLPPAQVEAGAGVLREVKLGIPSPSFRSPGEQKRGRHSLGVCPCPSGGVSGERRCGWTLSSTYLFVVF